MEAFGGFGILALILVATAVVMGLRLVNQYEKGVIFRLGRVSA